MKEICIKCKSCGQRYTLGKDAAVVTSLGVMADFQRTVVFGNGASFFDNQNNPDLVASLGRKRGRIEPSVIRNQQTEIARILSQLSARRTRWWKCQACGTVQVYHFLKESSKRSEEKTVIGEKKSTTLIAKRTQIIEVEADSLEEARERIKSQIPADSQLLNEEVISSGTTRSIKGIADTTEAAFEKAQSKVPSSAETMDKKVLVNPGRRTVKVEAFDEYNGMALLKPQLNKSVRVEKLILVSPGSKGFLGIGKSPNSYEAQIVQQAIIEITYKEKVKIRATVGGKLVALDGLLRNGSHKERIEAAETLAKSGLEGVSILMEAVKDKNQETYEVAAWGIQIPLMKHNSEQIGKEKLRTFLAPTTEYLIDVVKQARILRGAKAYNGKVSWAIGTLGAIGDSAALPALEELLAKVQNRKNDDGDVRKYIQTPDVVGFISKQDSIDHLEAAIKDIRLNGKSQE